METSENGDKPHCHDRQRKALQTQERSREKDHSACSVENGTESPIFYLPATPAKRCNFGGYWGIYNCRRQRPPIRGYRCRGLPQVNTLPRSKLKPVKTMTTFKSAIVGCLVAAIAVLLVGEHTFDVVLKSWGFYPIVIGLTAVMVGRYLDLSEATAIGAPLTIMSMASFVGDATFGWACGGALVLVTLALSAKPKLDERRKVAAEKKAEATIVETTPTATTKTTLVQKTVAAAKAVLPKSKKSDKEPTGPKENPSPKVADVLASTQEQVPASALA